MRTIILHGPIADRLGHFRDAGSVLRAGDGVDGDMDAATAAALVALAQAAWAATDSGTALDPLDHDGDGRKGGSVARTKAGL